MVCFRLFEMNHAILLDAIIHCTILLKICLFYMKKKKTEYIRSTELFNSCYCRVLSMSLAWKLTTCRILLKDLVLIMPLFPEWISVTSVIEFLILSSESSLISNEWCIRHCFRELIAQHSTNSDGYDHSIIWELNHQILTGNLSWTEDPLSYRNRSNIVDWN